MLPLLRASTASPRIVNVASSAGRLRGSPALQAAFTAPTLNVPELTSLMNRFVRDAESGLHTERGWPNTCASPPPHAPRTGNVRVAPPASAPEASQNFGSAGYGVSKMGVIALTRILARDEPTIMVNSADPGYCATDQNNHQGFITAQEGAVTPAALSLASFPGGGVVMSGKHFYENREINWSYS